ncbi:hypothetical protein PV334_20230 [Streptomyces sp. ME02-7008A-1]|uniref:hypothetical protein n=1 Tax=unclassified Streptomyces TaxID=2593676 RepID=UPI0029B57EA8|nr:MULTISPECIES: hypothetical protein [unclassified Streptomyces]MDX3183578.1 hypothetical protein [Streptomyces sp. ME02-7008A-1]MDX3304030.1 hypothetical protein [Streptomyces sp. ME02-7008A]
MLRAVYEAADLDAGVISDWREDRGLLQIRVDRHAKPEEFTKALNGTLADILERAHWYQVWKGEVISITSPSSPLRVQFKISDFSPAPLVDMRERKGLVTVHVSPEALVDEFVQALNAAVGELLAGGQWFQHWEGEIVTMDSPEAALV